MPYDHDKRIVMTLDAGGTKFSFSAIQSNKENIEPIVYSAKGENIDQVLKTIIKGFEEVKSKLSDKPVAISFAFPGPADFKNGIIGDLENLPAFRGGVPLKAMLENIFEIPVYINNDGDLFTYGESIAGLLPEVNNKLKQAGIGKQYRNLFGVTFGTGFGGGIVLNGKLMIGDNSAGGEINRTRNKLYPQSSVEESVSIRGVKRVFAGEAGIPLSECPDTKEIFEIGMGMKQGNQTAAKKAFNELAVVAGDTIANSISLIDGLLVIGGGLSGAYPLFIQKIVDEMNNDFKTLDGKSLQRMEIQAFNLEDKEGMNTFLKDEHKTIPVPFSDKTVNYNPAQKTGVGISRLGTSKAVSIGAYAFALGEMDTKIK